MMLQTDGYEFEFPNALCAFKFDETNKLSEYYHGVTQLKAVDVIVEFETEYHFIEIKHYDVDEFTKDEGANMLNYKWLKNYLKYKFRDSFLYRYAELKTDKPITYLCLLNFDTALLNKMHNDMKRELPIGVKSNRWSKSLADKVFVLNEAGWNRNSNLFGKVRKL